MAAFDRARADQRRNQFGLGLVIWAKAVRNFYPNSKQ